MESQVVRLLLEHGAEVNARESPKGRTAFDIAIEHQQLEASNIPFTMIG
jgi:ankyrin repeat protein